MLQTTITTTITTTTTTHKVALQADPIRKFCIFR